MKILVTGASGFIGGHLLRDLLAVGHDVWGTSRDKTRLDLLPEAKRVEINFEKSEGNEELENLLRTEQFDAVAHSAALCASWGSWSHFYRVNTLATVHLFELSARYGVKHFIHLSSPSVLAELSHCHDMGESRVYPKPLNQYALSKQLAEIELLRIAGNHDIRLSIVRPQAVFGKRDPHLMPRLLKLNHSKGIPLINDGAHFIDVTPVENVIEALLVLLASMPETNEIYHVSERSTVDFKNLLEKMFIAYNENVRWKPLALPVASIVANTSERIHKILGLKSEPLLTRYSLSVLAYTRTLDCSKLRQTMGYKAKYSVVEAIENLKVC